MTEDVIIDPKINEGVQVVRSDNTVNSAQNIIRRILNDYLLEESGAEYAQEEPEAEYAEEQTRMYEEVVSPAETSRLPSDYREERVRLEARLAQMEAETRR